MVMPAMIGGREHNACTEGRGRASLFCDISECVEVLGGDAAGRDAGADPEQAGLLLRVDAQHVSPLPHVVVFHVHLRR